MAYYHGICENCGKEYKFIPHTKICRQCEGRYLFISCGEIVGSDSNGNPKICGGFVELFQHDSSTNEDTSE